MSTCPPFALKIILLSCVVLLAIPSVCALWSPFEVVEQIEMICHDGYFLCYKGTGYELCHKCSNHFDMYRRTQGNRPYNGFFIDGIMQFKGLLSDKEVRELNLNQSINEVLI